MSSRRRMITSAGFKVEQIKNLPIGSKIKFSSGKTFILQAKNVSGHTQNTATFVSEYIIENSRWYGGYDGYEDTLIHESLMPKYYNELTELEKSEFVPYGSYLHFWLPYTSAVTGSTFGFTSKTRIKRYSSGKTGTWWTSSHTMREGSYSPGTTTIDPDGTKKTQHTASYTGYADYITEGGSDRESRTSSGRIWFTRTTLTNGNYYDSRKTYSIGSFDSTEHGVVPFCDINGDAFVRFKSGYWIFVNK